jgi:hypothetical protein
MVLLSLIMVSVYLYITYETLKARRRFLCGCAKSFTCGLRSFLRTSTMDTPWTWEKINAESNAVTAFHAALTQKNQLLTDPSLPYAAYQSLRAEVEREIEILTQRNDAVELQRKARQDADAAVFKGAVQRLSQINHQGDGVAPAGDEEAKPASPKVEGAHQGPNSQAGLYSLLI